jgi:predicted regulator of Ras-like GTPase activity (Roadblock/LC7/MglB family)
VIDDIRAWTAELAADPSSLIFLRLGEALRRRSQIEAALKVAVAGLTRYPHLPDAHDLYARILSDAGDLERAFDEWDMTLRLAPTHAGALKGIGFLYFRAGENELALQHLEAALQENPGDEGLAQAVDRVRDLLQPPPPEAAEPESEPSAPAPTPDDRVLLVDAGGLPIRGHLSDPAGVEIGERIGALLAGTAREAARAAGLLGLGEWQGLLMECTEANLCLVKPTPETFLCEVQDAEVPIGQLGLRAERTARAARRWLEAMR